MKLFDLIKFLSIKVVCSGLIFSTEPLVDHPVRVNPQVSGIVDFDKSFGSSFQSKNFKTKTDKNGNYTLKNLPTEFKMTLRAAPIDGSKYDAYLGEFRLSVDKKRPRMISRLKDGR